MKCPHCGQEHPDSFQFCPKTGNDIQRNEEFLGCSNIECPDFGKRVLPLDSKFCPTCGAAVSSEKNALSLFLQKLKDGVVDYGGIVLGKTKIGELRRLGFRKADYSEKYCYVFINDELDPWCFVYNLSMREVNDPNVLGKLRIMQGGLIDKSVLLNKEKKVSEVGFSIRIAIWDVMEIWELANLIEDYCGFTEIEMNYVDYDFSETDFALVSDGKICGDYHALLEISDKRGCILVSICPLSEWTIKKTGETIRA